MKFRAAVPALAAALLTACNPTPEPAKPAAPAEAKVEATPAPAAPRPVISITTYAERIFAGYQENEVAADFNYRGCLLFADAKIAAISKDPRGNPVIELDSGNEFMPVRAHGIAPDVAIRLMPGESVRLEAWVAGSPRKPRSCSRAGSRGDPKNSWPAYGDFCLRDPLARVDVVQIGTKFAD